MGKEGEGRVKEVLAEIRVYILFLSLLSLLLPIYPARRKSACAHAHARGVGEGWEVRSASAGRGGLGRYFQPTRRRVGHAKWSPARFDFLSGEILAKAAHGARLEVA